MERRSAGSQDVKVGTFAQQRADNRAGAGKLLQVVEDQEQPLLIDPPDEKVEEISARVCTDPKDRGDRSGHELRISDRREVDEKDAVGKSVGHAACQLETKARLSAATWPGEGHKASATL
jgi:hypothetical protein